MFKQNISVVFLNGNQSLTLRFLCQFDLQIVSEDGACISLNYLEPRQYLTFFFRFTTAL